MSITALKAALPLLREYRRALYDSEVYPDGTLPADSEQEIARFDRAITLVCRALKRHRAARNVKR